MGLFPACVFNVGKGQEPTHSWFKEAEIWRKPKPQ
jgi:hypothetical protein